ncbi:ATPase, T2SS/T4P/T4SS family [Halopenitus persicus]|uniref:ATPase, T2SS/T4P/T4SS family n=1 Tax=Halopenitus persicus TaxID=1048396 RepID=UPI000BBA9387|nr:ATPase, T2SS/T4P/T4SS family [Halopenitus persicus]
MSGDTVETGATEFPDLPGSEGTDDDSDPPAAILGEYTWKEFMREHGYGDEVEAVYRDVDPEANGDTFFPFSSTDVRRVPNADDWDRVAFTPAAYLGCRPSAFEDRLRRATSASARFDRAFENWIVRTRVAKGEYTWEHFKWEYYYDDGRPPRDGGEIEPFAPSEHLGFHPDDIGSVLAAGAENARELLEIEDRRTVNVTPELDEDEFFSTNEGLTTLTNRYDLEKAVPMEKKRHFVEEDRYWVDKPYAFVVIFHSVTENEKKYYVIEPYLNEIEQDLVEFFSGKLRTSIKYSDEDVVVRGTEEERADLLEEETRWLIDRYNLRSPAASDDESTDGPLRETLTRFDGEAVRDRLRGLVDSLGSSSEEPDDDSTDEPTELEGISARPEPAVLAEDSGWLTEYQVQKVLRLIRRDFIGYERIDPIKHDINVEDISCDGYNFPVFVYHTDYENLITNIKHGEDRLDSFVIKIAQRSGKGISKRQPQVDATLPDGSRAQLTLGEEVSDHGTNYTIRQFKDVPFTPVDLINWKTFSLDEMAFLWLCIESNKSLIFAGGTASGKTTSLNAVSLFIPSNSKIVSIEDTREVELPQRNWIASVTRPSFSQDNVGDIDEFDLLEAGLRQRPDYIVMGEVRGEEGRTLFQVMSTGHTTYTTFHADTVDEVLKRFTTDPINVSKTLFTALDLISVQTQTRVQGRKVRRNKTITEINSYDAENDEVSVQDVYQWQPEEDEFLQHGNSKKLQEIAFDRGWTPEQLNAERFKRRTILAYLITNGLNTYTEVAATLQAFINDPETILTMIANERLEESLADLREMESVLIDVDPVKEALVPRPEPGSDVLEEAERILEVAEDRIFKEYRGKQASSLADALSRTKHANDATASPERDPQMLMAVDDADDQLLADGATSDVEMPKPPETVDAGETTRGPTPDARVDDADVSSNEYDDDEPTSEAMDEPTSEAMDEPTSEAMDEPTSEAMDEPTSEAMDEPTSEAMDEPTSEAMDEPTSEAMDEPTSEAMDEPTSEAMDEPTSEAMDEPTSGATDDDTQERE